VLLFFHSPDLNMAVPALTIYSARIWCAHTLPSTRPHLSVIIARPLSRSRELAAVLAAQQ